MNTGYVPHNKTGIYPDWDTINIWMDRDPIQIHENANEWTSIAKLSGLGQTPDLDVTYMLFITTRWYIVLAFQ